MSSLGYEMDIFEIFGPNLGHIECLNEIWDGAPIPFSQSMMLDIEKNKIVKAPARGGKRNGVFEEKSVEALKSHSDAERRRRERINSHLNTLRGLVPNTEKMEKAALLAEVITQVNEMKGTAVESSQGLLIPMDNQEIKVNPLDQKDGTFLIKVSLHWEYKPELLSEMRQTLNSHDLSIVKAEMSTLRNWVRSEFVLVSKKDVVWDNAEACQLIAKSVHQGLSSILEKMAVADEYSPRITLPYRKRKASFVDSMCSSLLE